MKIVIFANYDMGLYKFRKELLESLLADHEVHIVVPAGDYTDEMQKMGCIFHDVSLNRRGTNIFQDFRLFRHYLSIIKAEKPDLVLTYTIKPNLYGGIACRIRRIPYFVNITGLGTTIENPGLLGKVLLKLYKAAMKKADCVFYQNEENRNFMLKKGIKGKKEILLPGSGVNLKEHCLEPYPEYDGKLTFLFVGRLMKDKGVGELVDAAKVILSKHKNVCFRAVGFCEPGYEAVLKEKHAKQYVELCGPKDNVHEYMKQANAVILPSYHEGMANVLLEAAACGRPVLASRVPGCMETFDEGITGYGFEAKNENDLVRAIEKFIELDDVSRAGMGLAGRRKVEKEFDRNLVINAYKKEMQNIQEG